jgi:hypothetical protein
VPSHRSRRLAAFVVLLVPLAACGDDDAAAPDDAASIRADIVDFLDAEAAGDGERLVAHFTDHGLEAQYGSTREQLLGPDSVLGEDVAAVLRDVEVTIDGDTAVALTDLVFGRGLVRVPFDFVRRGEVWLVDDVGGVDAPPAPDGVPDIDVSAVEYAFQLEPALLESGRFRIQLHNGGQQQHELTLFRLPEGTTTADGVTALTSVHGDSLDNVPDGYALVDHIAFTEAGEDSAYLLADPLEPGDYAFVCLIPEGGLDPSSGEPVHPGGAPHVSLGMYTPFSAR